MEETQKTQNQEQEKSQDHLATPKTMGDLVLERTRIKELVENALGMGVLQCSLEQAVALLISKLETAQENATEKEANPLAEILENIAGILPFDKFGQIAAGMLEQLQAEMKSQAEYREKVIEQFLKMNDWLKAVDNKLFTIERKALEC